MHYIFTASETTQPTNWWQSTGTVVVQVKEHQLCMSMQSKQIDII